MSRCGILACMENLTREQRAQLATQLTHTLDTDTLMQGIQELLHNEHNVEQWAWSQLNTTKTTIPRHKLETALANSQGNQVILRYAQKTAAKNQLNKTHHLIKQLHYFTGNHAHLQGIPVYLVDYLTWLCDHDKEYQDFLSD